MLAYKEKGTGWNGRASNAHIFSRPLLIRAIKNIDQPYLKVETSEQVPASHHSPYNVWKGLVIQLSLNCAISF